MYAASRNNESLCMMLVEKGADVNAKSKVCASVSACVEGGICMSVFGC